MPTKPGPLRPTRPADAFPDNDYRRWRDVVLDCDLEPLYAAAMAERLNEALEQRLSAGDSLRTIAAQTGLSRSSISRLARCETYPMMGMIARLELALKVPLWPSDWVHLAREDALQTLLAERTEALKRRDA